jgi:hypothetical protein
MLLYLDFDVYFRLTDLQCDVISGLTVALTVLPQGLAYAIIADLPQQVNLALLMLPLIIYTHPGILLTCDFTFNQEGKNVNAVRLSILFLEKKSIRIEKKVSMVLHCNNLTYFPGINKKNWCITLISSNCYDIQSM